MELDLGYEVNTKGRVSDRCRFLDEGGCRYVLVDEKLAYLYDLNDSIAARQISVFLYRSKAATQKELAQALGVTERTLRNWVAKYRKEGAAGLVDKLRPGAPVKLTDEVIKQIRRYRQERMKVTEIAQVMNLGFGSVCRVLYQNKGMQSDLFDDRNLTVDNKMELGETGKGPASKSSLSTALSGTEADHEAVEGMDRERNQAGSLSRTNPQLGKELPGEVDEGAASAMADTKHSVGADRSLGAGSKGEKVSVEEGDCEVEIEKAGASAPVLICSQSELTVQRDSAGVATIESSDFQAERGSIDECGVQDLEHFVPSSDSGKDLTDGLGSSVVDPLDRSSDRMWARLGMIEDGPPIFVMPGREDKIEFAGAFLAIALLAGDPYLKVAKAVYGSFGASFYGIRSMFLSFLLMALLRIKNSEEIRDYNPHKIGRLLGLDRSPEVKTLRRKLRELCFRKKAVILMERLSNERVSRLEQPVATLYIDGHVKSYYGKFKIGKTHSSSLNKVVKGSTDYWVNLPGGQPLLCVSCQFNESLTRILPQILKDVEKVCPGKKATLIFDRGGYSAELFEKLIAAGYDFITYGKNREPADKSCFKKEKTTINGKTYQHAPYERTAILPVYSNKKTEKGRSTRIKTKRTVELREIIILRDDDRQTSVLTTLKPEIVQAEKAAEDLFARWSQENCFKYMIREFDLDHLPQYGTDELDGSIDHPNPEYTRQKKLLKKVTDQIGRLLGKKAEELTNSDMKKILQELSDFKKGKQGKKLMDAVSMRKTITSLLETIPDRIPATDFKRLKSEMKLFINAIKISAYHIETKLVDILKIFYKDTAKDGRTIIAAALKSSGSLRIESNQLIVTIENQSSPQRTRLLRFVCAHLNAMKAKYPSSNLTLVFQMENQRNEKARSLQNFNQ